MSYPTKLYINAKFSFNEDDEEPNSFVAELPIGIEYVKSVELNMGAIVYTPLYPNLTPNDNMLSLWYNGVLLSYALPTQRVYTSPTDLCNVINTITGGAVGTFSFDANYIRFDYTPTLPADTWRFVNAPNNCLLRLGARELVDIPLAPAFNTGNYQFELYPVLLQTSCLYLTCSISDTSKTNRIGAGIPNILSMYPMSSGEVGSVLNFQLTNSFVEADTISGTVRNIEFQIRDDNFDIIELTHNTPLSLELTLQYEDIVKNNSMPFKIFQ